jgi:hypothetical protein
VAQQQQQKAFALHIYDEKKSYTRWEGLRKKRINFLLMHKLCKNKKVKNKYGKVF